MDDNLINEMESLIIEGREKILPTKWVAEGVIGARPAVNGDLYAGWFVKCMAVLSIVFGKDDLTFKKFMSYEKHYYVNAQAAIKILESVLEYYKRGIIAVVNCKKEPELDLNLIFSNFHIVARQLRNRHNNRDTIEINDEYDVQDLLHALLKLFFNDVRPEEWTPSYAGSSSRMDFLIKEEKIAIEVKMTRKGLSDRVLGEQLIVDIEKYKNHPDCEKLICFVYDPEGRIGNPVGLANDLQEKHKGFLEVYIKPLF